MKIQEYDIREFHKNGFDDFLKSFVKEGDDSESNLLKKSSGLATFGLGNNHHPEELSLIIKIEDLTASDITIDQNFTMKSVFDTELKEWNTLLDKLTYLMENFNLDCSMLIRLKDERNTYSTWASSLYPHQSSPTKNGTWRKLTKFYKDNSELFVQQW